MNQFRRLLGQLTRVLGDLQAIKNGRIGWRTSRRLMRKIIQKWFR